MKYYTRRNYLLSTYLNTMVLLLCKITSDSYQLPGMQVLISPARALVPSGYGVDFCADLA